MAPDPGRTYTVGCSFEKLVPDECHKQTIRDAVSRTHRATILATELLNLHVRRCIEEHDGEGLELVLSSNWLINVYYEVTLGKAAPITLLAGGPLAANYSKRSSLRNQPLETQCCIFAQFLGRV